ncbi:MAG: hypothetical protein ACRBF0_23450 [Calditrichia bacterium]
MRERDHLEEKYSRYIEGELSRDLDKRMEEELLALGSDGETILQLRKNRELLQNLATVSTSVGFEQRLHARVREEGNSARSRSLPSSFTDWRGIAAAACVALLMVFGGYFLTRGAVEPDVPAIQQSGVEPLLQTPQRVVQPSVVDDEGKDEVKKDSISTFQQEFNGKRNSDVQFINEQNVKGN